MFPWAWQYTTAKSLSNPEVVKWTLRYMYQWHLHIVESLHLLYPSDSVLVTEGLSSMNWEDSTALVYNNACFFFGSDLNSETNSCVA